MEAARSLPSPLGRITISSEVVAQIVARVSAEAYGVVAMGGRRMPRLRSRRGIQVGREGDAVTIDLAVVVEYGLNLGEVASTLRNRVTYEVERLTGLRVAAVEVHIQDVKSA